MSGHYESKICNHEWVEVPSCHHVGSSTSREAAKYGNWCERVTQSKIRNCDVAGFSKRKNTHYFLLPATYGSASFQTNQVERENHKPRPTSIQCSSIIFMHFLLFAKLGGWNCKVSRISWLPSKLIGLQTLVGVIAFMKLGRKKRKSDTQNDD